MDKQTLAENVIQKMMADDAFSRWLGIEVLEVKPGYVKLGLDIRPEMNNGFSITHGGIAYSLADSALAFASNSHGRVAVALETNISYIKKVSSGDTLTATAEQISLGNRVGVYIISIRNQENSKVAQFRGTVFRTKEKHIMSEE